MRNCYNLSYVKDDRVIPIDLSGIYAHYDVDIHSIKTLDDFTISFPDQETLVEYFKVLKLIPNEDDINKIYMSHTVKKNNKISENIIYDGDILLFQNDRIHLDIEYVKYILDKYRDEPVKLKDLGELYLSKYRKTPSMARVACGLYGYGKIKTEVGFRCLSNSEIMQLESDLREFIDKEFYRKSKDKKEKTVKYQNVRDFLIKQKYAEGLYNIHRTHSYNRFNVITDKYFAQEVLVSNKSKKPKKQKPQYIKNETEEFLTMEDYEMSNREIIDSLEGKIPKDELKEIEECYQSDAIKRLSLK